jgi:hypothetical protein
MQDQLVHLAYEVELQPGEKLQLPPGMAEQVGPGRWLITVQPADSSREAIRQHSAFLNSYAPEDEGLYDDYPGR